MIKHVTQACGDLRFSIVELRDFERPVEESSALDKTNEIVSAPCQNFLWDTMEEVVTVANME